MTTGARKYDSSRRQQQGRDRIMEAALDLARASGGWNWVDITFKTVADAAGVSERTVYRHFPTQTDLHEALMLRINQNAEISYEGLSIDDVSGLVGRLFVSLSTFDRALHTQPKPSEAAIAMNRDRMQALLDACGGDRRLAALLDVLWSVDTYERLSSIWRMPTDDAIEAVTWAIGRLLPPEGQS